MPEIKYQKAVQRLDDIIQQIENDSIDVDELSARVKEAAGLIKTCKQKIEKARLEVKEVVDGFEEDDALSGDADAA